MHPEIRRRGPGSCPVCGMALEPLVATASTLLAGVVAGVSGSDTRNGISSVSRLEEYSTATIQHMAAAASGLSSRVVLWLAILRPGRNVVA